MSKTTKYKLKMFSVYCIGKNCENTLRLLVHEANSLTMAGVYQRHKWFVSPSWNNRWKPGVEGWDGSAYCPDHEDDAMRLAYDGQ